MSICSTIGIPQCLSNKPVTTVKATCTGTYTTQSSGNYQIITFTSSGTIAFQGFFPNVTYLAVGGGGGGGDQYGGGGGAGGVVTGTVPFKNSTLYTITIGQGGASKSNGTATSIIGSKSSLIGVTGNTLPGLTGVTAMGGGYGAGGITIASVFGGGGGGASSTNDTSILTGAYGITGPFGIIGQGNSGGNGRYTTTYSGAGGGGGYSSTGSSSIVDGTGGAGGAGYYFSYTNSYYAGGGGGNAGLFYNGGSGTLTPGIGGSNVGGTGSDTGIGGNAIQNTGSGGGGGGSAVGSGGAGSSGVVIFVFDRYQPRQNTIPFGFGTFTTLDLSTVPIDVCYYKPTTYLNTTSPLIIQNHGIERNYVALPYTIQSMAYDTGSLVVSTYFDKARFSANAYTMDLPTPIDFSQEYKWPYAYISDVIAYVEDIENTSFTNDTNIPGVTGPNRLYVMSFSGGSQMNDRSVYFLGTNATRLMISSPGSWLFPNYELFYPYGLLNLTPSVPALLDYLHLNMIVTCGENDTSTTGTIDQSAEAEKQGANRIQRATNFYLAGGTAAAALGTSLTWSLYTVPGAGHNPAQVFGYYLTGPTLFGNMYQYYINLATPRK